MILDMLHADLRADLVDLQSRFAFQEDALQAVHATLLRQQQEVDRLARRCERLEQFCQELADALASRSVESVPPPHY